MTESLKVQAPAKINLFLKVLGRREDGFHDIYSLLQTVSLYDELTFTPIKQGIELEISGADLAADQSNLVWRAADLLRQRFGLSGGVHIKLDKQISMGAGLGGGSSDAAATLLALDQLFGLGLTSQQLGSLAAELGSDVPFFLSGGQALISGRGEVVEEVRLSTDYSLILILPNFSISTAWAYQQLRKPLTSPSPIPSFERSTRGQGLFEQLRQLGNDFETVVTAEYPVISVLLDGLRRAGAGHAALTGSGSAVFGIFAGGPTPDALATLRTSPDVRLYELWPVCR